MIDSQDELINLLRGIAKKEWIEDGFVLSGAFQFQSIRDDGFTELSINWHDDDGAVAELLGRPKDGQAQAQFPGGVAIIDRARMRFSLASHLDNNNIRCIRDTDDCDNPYHGLLLLKNDISKALKRIIVDGLCLAVNDNIIPNE